VNLRIVDDRVLLLGFDKLYRDAMKSFERTKLLAWAREVAKSIGVAPADVPVEGYYASDPVLAEYFKLMRALQEVDERSESRVSRLTGYKRLSELMGSPLFGRPVRRGKLFPVGRDALSQALDDTKPNWTVQRLVQVAFEAADAYDDFSLVGLAARIRDPVVLTALRESVVLYAEFVAGASLSKPVYEWRVDSELARQANRFIDTFNGFVASDSATTTPLSRSGTTIGRSLGAAKVDSSWMSSGAPNSGRRADTSAN
jgi:hypothetical protein